MREEGAQGEADGAPVAKEGRRQPLSAYRLPPGKHGIPGEQVVENQRWRLLGAAAETLAERGYARIRGADVCARAGVSRETLYENFEGVDDCLHAAHEMAADCVLDLASGACGGDPPGARREYEDRLRGALEQVLQFLADEPALAHLLGPEAAAGVPAIATARERLIEQLTDGGAARHGVEGALALVADRVAAGEAARLPELADQLVDLIDRRGPATDAVR